MSQYRCLICGRFFSSPRPDDFACDDHAWDWRALPESEKAHRVHMSIYSRTVQAFSRGETGETEGQ